MILTPSEMAAAEAALFSTGVEAEPLMDRAGRGIAEAVMQFHPRPGLAIAFVGDGHNGGDALVVMRHLRAAGWRVAVRFANGEESLKPLTKKKREQLGGEVLAGDKATPARGEGLLLIDGLLGIGARGPLRPAYAEATAAMNALRLAHGGHTVAIDIPSGLDGANGDAHPGAVVADLTCTIGHAKPGLLADGAADNVGRLALVPLEEIEPLPGDGDSNALLVTPGGDSFSLRRRAFDTHKGDAGQVGVVAGSPGMTGAATLCATAALRGGAGLVTLFSDLAVPTPPEVMLKPRGAFSEVRLDALAVGPGIGAGEGLLEALLNDPRPMVIDADALNLLARETDLAGLREAPGARVLTPHPGEMARLETAAGLDSGLTRRERAEALAAHTGGTVLLKGARTVIATTGSATAFNTTGHPGMASGGVGDTLTGLIAALLAGGTLPHTAACVGSWLNGRAAEIAIRDRRESAESLAASDLTENFGRAFHDWRRNAF